jgi:hypothetical protein
MLSRVWSRVSFVMGGLGLLGCAACCVLPLLGAVSLGSGLAVISGVLGPVTAALLGLGVALGVVGFVSRRRRSCGR